MTNAQMLWICASLFFIAGAIYDGKNNIMSGVMHGAGSIFFILSVFA